MLAEKETTIEVLLFIGLQASGKSTYYREHFLTTHLLISKDLMRNNRRKDARQQDLLRLALQAKHSVVIDNTNPTPRERAPLIALAHDYHATVIGYYFITTVRQALERNARRANAASVPPVAIYSAAARMIQPTYAEGFNRLYYVQIAEHSTPIAPAWQIKEMQHE